MNLISMDKRRRYLKEEEEEEEVRRSFECAVPVHHDSRSDRLCDTLELRFIRRFPFDGGHRSGKGHCQPISDFVRH